MSADCGPLNAAPVSRTTAVAVVGAGARVDLNQYKGLAAGAKYAGIHELARGDRLQLDLSFARTALLLARNLGGVSFK